MKEPLFVAFATQKGGVGKTAVKVLTASCLHYVKGYNVAKVADDELDEAFSDTSEIDVADVPLEWDDDPPINYE